MPHIVFMGLGVSEFEESSIQRIEHVVTLAAMSVTELGLGARDVSFTFVYDPSVTSNQVPLVVELKFFSDKPERTTEVRKRLAELIARAIKGLPNNESRMIEVGIPRFDPERDGYTRIDP